MLTPAPLSEFLHPDDVEKALAAFAEVIAGIRDPEAPILLRVRSTDGSC